MSKKYKIFFDKEIYDDCEIEVVKIPFDKYGMNKNQLYFVEDRFDISEFIPLSTNNKPQDH